VIPRVLHYCWLSGAPWDELTRRCFESWERHLGSFDFRLWDASRLPTDVRFLNRMLAGGDWAYASDYIRLRALYEEGGIYLGLDVEVIRSLEPLLADRAFLGYEDASPALLGCHVIAAEPRHPFIRRCMDFYEQSWKLRWSFPPTMPRIVTDVARRHFGYSTYASEGQTLTEGVRVHPAHYFSPLGYRDRRIEGHARYATVQEGTYALHHWRHGWSWLHAPLQTAVPRVPWLFMTLRDWWFILRELGVARASRGMARTSLRAAKDAPFDGTHGE
jgi:hypothetical protein